MPIAYLDAPEFLAAKEQFEKLVIELQSSQFAAAEHGIVEEHIKTGGFEVLRLLFQGNLDVRANNEAPLEHVTGVDGRRRAQVRPDCEKNLMTLFGQVVVRRTGYRMRKGESLFPMDGQLNLPTDKYSHGLRKQLANEVLAQSFDGAVAQLMRNSGGKMPKFQAEQATSKLALDFELFYAKRHNIVEQTSDLLIVTVDSKGIVMNKNSLRECTQKAAQHEQHKMKTRLSKGEKGNRKRMATVASVYSVAKHVRTPESLIKSKDSPQELVRPKVKNKRVWASVERDPKQVTEELFEEALRRDPQRQRQWVVLLDGQPSQLNNVRATISKHNLKNVSIVLDIVHVLEYLWQAAFCFYPEGSEETETFVRERLLNLLRGIPGQVAAGLRRKATLHGLTPEQREAVDRCADYIQKYKKLMQYRHHLKNGFPIATGVIEGACRHLIKDRMDITGARWGLQTAESILKLRSLRSSGDLNDYWEFHQAQELQRNHKAQYFRSQLPLAA